MSEMTPRQVVQHLDQHIIGQSSAKRAVAIALRNRWRWLQLSDEMRKEVTPRNILMIGPTGVGTVHCSESPKKVGSKATAFHPGAVWRMPPRICMR